MTGWCEEASLAVKAGLIEDDFGLNRVPKYLVFSLEEIGELTIEERERLSDIFFQGRKRENCALVEETLEDGEKVLIVVNAYCLTLMTIIRGAPRHLMMAWETRDKQDSPHVDFRTVRSLENVPPQRPHPSA